MDIKFKIAVTSADQHICCGDRTKMIQMCGNSIAVGDLRWSLAVTVKEWKSYGNIVVTVQADLRIYCANRAKTWWQQYPPLAEGDL